MTREEAVARIKDHIEIHKYHERNAVKIFEAFEMAIQALSEPERKKERWEYSDDMFETGVCPYCGWDSGEPVRYAHENFNYCPKCGEKIKGEKE